MQIFSLNRLKDLVTNSLTQKQTQTQKGRLQEIWAKIQQPLLLFFLIEFFF